jgi:hypothetical protein
MTQNGFFQMLRAIIDMSIETGPPTFGAEIRVMFEQPDSPGPFEGEGQWFEPVQPPAPIPEPVPEPASVTMVLVGGIATWAGSALARRRRRRLRATGAGYDQE